MSKCDQCEKGFGSDGAPLQHYSSKHPGVTPPQNLEGDKPSNGGKREEKRRKNSRRRQRGRGGKKLLLLGLLIVIVASVSAY